MNIEELVQASSVVLLTGRNGVDRTTAALSAASRMSGDFPDGQLYADLRDEAPASVAGRFRRELPGRRVLVVLDNVASEAQVRPLLSLLSRADGCRTLITSRTWLGGLPGIRRYSVR